MNRYIEEMQNLNEEALSADGFDDCIIGIGITFGKDFCFIYDQDKMIDKMMKDGMTSEEAYEFFEYNILGAYLGESMPIFMIGEQ